MTRKHLLKMGGTSRGAVAPTVALSLFALIGAGGIAFDYARMATLDTELQNAADQAALAAATQLDKGTDACARAAAAANTLVSNSTLFANDGDADGRAVTVFVTGTDDTLCDATGNVRFYQDKAKTTAATADDNARFVEVWVNGRRADFALTPVVSAFNSGTLRAAAFAGIGSAICKVPPFFMCPPAGVGTDPDAWKGRGLQLFEGSGGSWAPGNFGYLDVGAANNGSPDQRIAIGFNSAALSCVGDSTADVDTGVSASVIDAINVRFDIFTNGWSRNTCYDSNNCSSSFNTTKDLVMSTSNVPSKTTCGIANGQWEQPATDDRYIPTNDAGDDATVQHMGYSMDICHYKPISASLTACSNGRMGNGSWRRDIYFKTNHPTLSNATGSNWQSVTGLSATASRYDFYQWEISSNNRPNVVNGTLAQRGAPVCKAPGLAAGENQPDRRVIAMAVASNCGSLGGSNVAVNIASWAEVFLVQPSTRRRVGSNTLTGDSDIYVEIIGKATPSGDGTNAQVIRRDVPYLIE